ncbi:hypothetical protein AWB75_00184 [Caballeronia catudaia]|uniref:Uncharacterized protein n=1 Tax=Caballeronia catudaia TaxID=1777136 RepID=A0A157Z454_9BURK|nr:hypothetical protein [Caballeronia catudaia]SAK40292.1 hypothetical protein AWB75_00184 [Caballeronia catudaia]
MKKPDRRQAESGSLDAIYPMLDYNGEHEQLELLPLPPFAPTWPRPGTLPALVLDRLLTGERLTQPLFGTSYWRLAAYVQTLEDLGWSINCDWVHEAGYARPIKRYWLPPRVLMAARTTREGLQ